MGNIRMHFAHIPLCIVTLNSSIAILKNIFVSTMGNMICVQENSQIRTIFKHLLAKYRLFKEIPQKFSSMLIVFLDQLLLPYKFYGNSMRGILFFNFASCESLKPFGNLSKKWLKKCNKYMGLQPPHFFPRTRLKTPSLIIIMP